MEINKEYERKCFELAHYIFPDVSETVDDLEIRYKERNLPLGACVTRFAPSPTGFLHTGALFTTTVNKRLADQTGGVYYLRVEDTDTKREVEGAIKLFTSELAKFGLTPTEGVISPEKEVGDYGPYTQSKRKEIYRICAKHLVELGLAYPCFCTPEMIDTTRKSQEANKIVPGYYGVYAKCRNISIDEAIERVKSGEEYILRFRSNGSHLNKISFIDEGRGKIEIAENDLDIVLIKKDGLPTYHFAHVVDDHFMHTTHVVRGEEWIPSTPIHLELFNAMGFEAPKYVHVPLIMVKDGESRRKLSKRKDKEAAVSYFLQAGYEKEAMSEYIMTIANSDFESWRAKNKDANISEFEFKVNKMSSSGSLLDIPKLNDISKEIISKMDSKTLIVKLMAWADEYNKPLFDRLNSNIEYTKKVFALERDNATKVRKDIYKWEDILDTFFYFWSDLYSQDVKENGYSFDYNTEESTKMDKEIVNKILKLYSEKYDESLDKDAWFNALKEYASEVGLCTDMKEYKQNKDKYIGSVADFASTIRIAITNRKNTPDIYSIMQILGKDEVKNRLNNAIK